MDAPRLSVAGALPLDDWGAPDAAPDQDTRLLAERLPELARQYAEVTTLPTSVEALWRGYQDQQRCLLEFAAIIDRQREDIERLARRLAKLERQP